MLRLDQREPPVELRGERGLLLGLAPRLRRRRLERVHRLVARLLGAQALGDVEAEPEHLHLPRAPQERQLRGLDPAHLAVGPGGGLPERDRLAAVDHLPVDAEVALRLRVVAVHLALAPRDHLLRRQPVDRRVRLVREHEPAVSILHEHEARDAVERGAEQPVLLGERPLRGSGQRAGVHEDQALRARDGHHHPAVLGRVDLGAREPPLEHGARRVRDLRGERPGGCGRDLRAPGRVGLAQGEIAIHEGDRLGEGFQGGVHGHPASGSQAGAA